MKTFDLSEYAKKLAFGLPVVEPTAPCHKCYQETVVKNLDNDCLCENCRKKTLGER